MNVKKVYPRHVVQCSASPKPSLVSRIVSTVALGTALTGSCIISFPYILRSKVGLRSFTTLVSSTQPRVGVSLEKADLGWFTQKPTLVGLKVYDKKSQRDAFTCRDIRLSKSLFDVMVRRTSADVFVNSPHVDLTDAVREASSLENDQAASSAFSAECTIDDRIHVYISEGSLDLTETVCAMLDGRLFVDVADTSGKVNVEVESPSFKVNVAGTRENGAPPSLGLSSPVHIEARVSTSLVDVLLRRMNPLLAGGVDVHSESVMSCDIQPDTGVLPAEVMHVNMSGYNFRIKKGKFIKDILGVISTFSSDLKNILSKDTEMAVTSSEAHIVIDQVANTMETTVEKISIDIPGYRHKVDLSISGTITGNAPNDAIEMQVSISASTLLDILGVRGGPLTLWVRGSSARPHILMRKAIIDLGLLMAQNM